MRGSTGIMGRDCSCPRVVAGPGLLAASPAQSVQGVRVRCSPKVEGASAEPPPPKLTSLADWAGPPDDSQLPGFGEQPPAPTPVDPLGLSPAALGGAHCSRFKEPGLGSGPSSLRKRHQESSCEYLLRSPRLLCACSVPTVGNGKASAEPKSVVFAFWSNRLPQATTGQLNLASAPAWACCWCTVQTLDRG